MLVWLSVWSKVQTCIWPSWCHCHSLSFASVKSRFVLPFWYRLTWVVLDKGPLASSSRPKYLQKSKPKIRPNFEVDQSRNPSSVMTPTFLPQSQRKHKCWPHQALRPDQAKILTSSQGRSRGRGIRRGQKVKANVYAESNFTRTLKQTDPTNPTALIYLRT